MFIKTDFSEDCSIKLVEIPLYFTEFKKLKNESTPTKFRFLGATHFIPYKKHYTAIIYMENKWWEFDDCSAKEVELSDSFILNPHLLIYMKENLDS